MTQPLRIKDAAGIGALVDQLVSGIVEALGPSTDVALVGVRRGGVALSRRVAGELRKRGYTADLGTVDISLYRDDAHLSWPRPSTGPTDIAFPVDGRHVIVVDDVFWTGRTARAAMDAVLDFGRPRRLWLATLVIRPGRELPVAPDFTPLSVSPSGDEQVELRLTEDGNATDELVVVGRKSR